MAKQSALGANLYLAQYDLSGDVGAVNTISGPRSTFDLTALNQSTPYRILGRRDGKIAFTGFWNTTAGQIMPVLSALPTTDVLTTIAIPATGTLAVGDPAVSLNGKQVSIEPTFGNDGSLGLSTSIDANSSGLEWGLLLTAGLGSIATGTVNGTAVDNTASTALGWAAYIHVVSMGSGTFSAKIQDSADNSSWADLSGAAFTDATGPTSQRIVGGATATVRRYVRLATSGTHATASVAVNFVRYATSQAI